MTMLEKIDSCDNNPELLETTEINKDRPCGFFPMLGNFSYDRPANKNFFTDVLIEWIDFVNFQKINTQEIINTKHKVKKRCHFTDKYRDVAHSICNLRYSLTREIHIPPHNGL